MMQGGSFEPNNIKIPVEKLDLFIDRCCNERDETLYSLAQALIFKLERGMHSVPEEEIYPKVITRIQQRLEEGGK